MSNHKQLRKLESIVRFVEHPGCMILDEDESGQLHTVDRRRTFRDLHDAKAHFPHTRLIVDDLPDPPISTELVRM